MLGRRILNVSLGIFVFLIIYNTLIPFNFQYGIGDIPFLLRRVDWIPYMGVYSRISVTDIVGNVLLFIPFGFFLYLVLNEAGVPHPLLLTALASFVFSAGIEAVQLFIPERNTAAHDLLNNTIGGIVGAVGAYFYTLIFAKHLRKYFYDLLHRKPFLLLLIIIGGLQAVAAALPPMVSITVSDLKKSLKAANIVPFAYESVGKLFFHSPNKLDTLPFNWFDFLENVLFWIAPGYLLWLVYRIYWRKKPYGPLLLWGLPLLYFPLLEFGQLFIVSRITDINDIIAGYLGVFLGFTAYHVFKPLRRKLYKKEEMNLLIIPLFFYGVFILFAGFRPFDWTLNPQVLQMDLNPENLIPFYAYFRKTSLWNIYDLANSTLYFLPIALYWTLTLRRKGTPFYAIYFRTILSGLLVGGMIEISQLFSPTRIAEITDVLAYGMGGALGTFLVYYYEREVRPVLTVLQNGLLELG